MWAYRRLASCYVIGEHASVSRLHTKLAHLGVHQSVVIWVKLNFVGEGAAAVAKLLLADNGQNTFFLEMHTYLIPGKGMRAEAPLLFNECINKAITARRGGEVT